MHPLLTFLPPETRHEMDLRALAVLAVLAIHALLVGFAVRGAGRSWPAHRDFAIQAALVTLWSAGRLATFFSLVETGLGLALIAGLGSVLALAPRLGVGRITAPLTAVAVGLLVAHAVLGAYAQPVVVPWLAVAGAVYLLLPVAAHLRDIERRGRTAPPLPPDVRAATPVLVLGALWHLVAGIGGFAGPRLDVVGVLTAEAVVLVMIRSRQVDLEPEAGSVLVRISQAVATSAVVLVGVAIVNRYLGVAMEPASVTSLSALAFAAAWLLGGSARWLEPLVERALFPERARYRALTEELARERESLRGRLIRSERLALVGELAASVAHEIKNPLGPIKGFAQMIAEDLERSDAALDREVLKRRIAVIVEEVDRIDARIRELLERARDPVEAPAACSLNELLERAVLLVAGDSTRRKAVRIETALDATAELPPILLRRRALEGAFVNLLLNALDAVAEDGEIRVATEVRNGAENTVEIRVADDGRGIEPERLARIFDPFETGRAGGVGLGLGIARRAVEAERGALRIDSELGRGTVATIVLPRDPTSTPPEPARPI